MHSGAGFLPGQFERPDMNINTQLYNQMLSRVSKLEGSEGKGHTLLLNDIFHNYLEKCLSGKRCAPEGHNLMLEIQRMLVDYWRARRTKKRGGGLKRHSISESAVVLKTKPQEIPDLTKALQELKKFNPLQAEMVRLRYYEGKTNKEVGLELGANEGKVENELRRARSWLKIRIKSSAEGEGY